jgi:hypothetical protein
MPAGFFVDGKLTYRPLVSVVTEFAGQTGLGPATKALAVTGEFPFLQVGVPYVFLSQDAFVSAVPANNTMRELASMIYSPSTVAPFAGSPAAVILMNVTPCTQAIGYIKAADVINNSIKLSPKVWGLQSNSTSVIVTDVALADYLVTISTRGASEQFKVSKGTGTLKLAYAHPTTDLVANTAYGYHDAGAGSGSLDLGVNVAPNVGEIALTFSRTLPHTVLKTAADGKSWIPNGPVNGALTIAKPAVAQTITDAKLDIYIKGTDANGLPVEEYVYFTKAQIEDAAAVTLTTDIMSSVDYVSLVGAGWVGNLTISGGVVKVGAAHGQDTVAEAVSRFNEILGLTATTDSFRPGSIQVADLDPYATNWNNSTVRSVSASKFLLLEAFNLYASLVTAESLAGSGVDLSANFSVTFSGGTESAVSATEWEAGFAALRTAPVTVLFPYSTEDGVHRAAFAHAKYMWGKGQREMQLVISPPNDMPLATLNTLRRGYSDFRVTVLPHKVRFTKWNGGVSDFQTKYLGLIFSAMQCANAEIGLPLGGSRPNVLAFSGHPSTLGEDGADNLIANCLTPLEDRGDGIRIVRWVTTFSESNDPVRTEGSAVECLAFSNIGVRTALRPLLNQKASPDMVTRIRIAVETELGRQLAAGQLRTWVRSSLQVQETASSYIVKYQVAPVLPVNNIAVTSVAIAFPLA